MAQYEGVSMTLGSPNPPPLFAAPPVAKVYACIAAVAEEMAKEGISKGRKNVQQGYSFRGIDDVYNALAPLLAKHKLVILPRVLGRNVVERPTQKGGVLFYVTVEVEFDFVCAEDASRHVIKTYGEAMDSADKATNKAMSAAYKYAAMQAFCIPTEGDNDADKTTHEPVPSAPPGFADWLIDLELIASEHGDEELQKTWKASKPSFKKYLKDFHAETGEAIKAKAHAFDKAKLAAPPPPVDVNPAEAPF